jgi:hypothetical protein
VLFAYAFNGLARNWRPDLVPTILKWVDTVPESEWAFFEHFSVGGNGQFVATFRKSPDRGGPPRTITHRFDHTIHTIQTDRSGLTLAVRHVYNPDHNTLLANVIA